ncbi:MAG: hypothetical protein Q9221_006634 [Calogaya cf. arnoldii]
MSNLAQRRTHNLLLIQKILSKPETSPFTLVLESVEQGAGGLVRAVPGVAKASKTNTIYISPSSLNTPSNITTHITSRRKTPDELRKEILAAVPAGQKTLLILPSLPPSLLQQSNNINLPTYLHSLLSPSTSLLLIHHVDIPLPSLHTSQTTPKPSSNPYAPSPLTQLLYTATTILTLSSFPQTLAKKKARDLAMQEPVYGIEEGREGVIVGMGANCYGMRGMVLEVEHRRKSGRSITEIFFMPSHPSTRSSDSSKEDAGAMIKGIILLDDHPLFTAPSSTTHDHAQSKGENNINEEDLGGTFNLTLTEKQRRDREGVVLPYYDAQRRYRGDDGEGGGERGEREGRGEGGRILYEMGEEDDFDEEEDEI